MATTQDRRRILGPADTQSLVFPTNSEKSTKAPKSKKHDGKNIRPVFIRTGPVANANGSAFWEAGDIQIQCSVHGPRPIRGSFIESAIFNVEAKLSPFSVNNNDLESVQSAQFGTGNGAARPNGTSALERTLASFVQSSLTPSINLDMYPKSGLDLFITVINKGSNSKALIAACVNAATVALIDASISLRDMVTCSSAVLLDKNSIYLDPEFPTPSAKLDMVMSFMTARNGEIVGMAIDGGEITLDILDLCVNENLRAATDIRTLINGVLLSEFRKKEELFLAEASKN